MAQAEKATQKIIQIAKKAVAAHDTWADRAVYRVDHKGDGWAVSADRIEGYDASGNPQFVPGGDRLIIINKEGKVTEYFRGL
jgi:hypothetical protein